MCCVVSQFSHVQPFKTLWTAALQASISMGFSRQEYRSGLPCPSLEDLPEPGRKPVSLTSPAMAGGFFTTSTTCLEGCKGNNSKPGSTCFHLGNTKGLHSTPEESLDTILPPVVHPLLALLTPVQKSRSG